MDLDDYLEYTLGMFPEPAALFDGDLRLVAANAAAWGFALDQPEAEPYTSSEWRERSGLAKALDVAASEGAYVDFSPTCDGWLAASLISGGFHMGRPDLLLATLYRGAEEVAQLSHARLVTTLRFNETALRTMSSMESLVGTARAIQLEQEGLLREFNQQSEALLTKIATRRGS